VAPSSDGRVAISPKSRSRRRGAEVGRIKVVLAGNADKREQGIAPGVCQRRPHALGTGSLGHRQTGQSEAIHSRRHGLAWWFIHPGCRVDGGGLDSGDLVLP
jgi:hypothetical protein